MVTSAMETDTRKSIFVTQLHDREEEDENLKRFPVVKESANQLLETGVNTLQKTLLLKKEVEVERVQVQLLQKREEFRNRMEICAERQVQLQKDQQKMKERVSKFEKFIAENEAKRRRAIQRYQTEVRLREHKSRELEEMAAELEILKAKHAKLQRKIEIYRTYEKFLLQSIEKLPEDYLEVSDSAIGSLMMRYDTLHATNRGLVSDLEENATQLERLKVESENLRQLHEKSVVSYSSDLAVLQKNQDKMVDTSKQKEEHYLNAKTLSRHELAELGQILMAISNIALKCQRKRKIRADEKPIASMNLEEKLEVIKEYMKDQRDVHNHALELAKQSRSGDGSAYRRVKVHFSE